MRKTSDFSKIGLSEMIKTETEVLYIMATYENQKAWRDIQEFLPAQLHYTESYHPTEEIWNWKGNKVHLDTFRNPDAPAKVICFHGVGTNGRQISMIIGGPLAKDGFETITVDMPPMASQKSILIC